MKSWKISDYARQSSDSHANCALVGGFLMLTGIAIGLAMAESSKAQAIQGEIQEQLGGHTPPVPPPTLNLNALISQAVAGFLK